MESLSQAFPERSALPSMDVPVIDVHLLLTPPSLTSSIKELNKLRSALTSFGCFQVINHGIDTEFLEQVHEVGRQFFRLPREEKKKYSKQNEQDGLHGYKDALIAENQTPEWSYRMNIVVVPEDERLLKFWPQSPPTFSKVLHEYGEKTQVIIKIILKAMARSLDLKENSFLDMQGERSRIFARFNYYPPCSPNDLDLDDDDDQLVLRFKPHSDGSVITAVLPDKKVEGLQFFNDNQWHKVSILPQALLINVGDQGEIVSNGIFKGPIHRVVTKSKQESISVAMISVPSIYKEIEPVDGLVGEGRPKLYRKLKNYEDFYYQRYWRGESPIEAAKRKKNTIP